MKDRNFCLGIKGCYLVFYVGEELPIAEFDNIVDAFHYCDNRCDYYVIDTSDGKVVY